MSVPTDSAALARPSVTAKPRPALAIGWAGLVAGTLDLIFAWVVFNQGFVGILKIIAGGWFGREAMQGRAGTALVGFLSHFTVAYGAAAAYWLASRLLPVLNRHAVIAGLLYGIVVYEVMHLVVLPLSAYHSPVQFASLLKSDVISHLFFVGLPIALITRRYSRL